MLGGVVGGISARYGWDRRAARVLTVVAALVVPVVVPLYLVAWILLPADPEPGRAPAELFQGGNRSWIGVGLVVVGVAMFFGGGWGIGPIWHDDLVGAIVLIGLGAWLWTRRPPESGDPGRPDVAGSAGAVPAPVAGGGPQTGAAASSAVVGPPGWVTGAPPPTSGPLGPPPGAGTAPGQPPPGYGTTAYGQPVTTHRPPPPYGASPAPYGGPPPYGAGGTAPYGAAGPVAGAAGWGSPWYGPGSPPGPPPGPPPARSAPVPAVRRPPVARVTAAVSLLALGLAGIGDRLGLFDLDLTAALALLLGIVGVGLVVGAVIGGGRWLLLPALLLGPLAIGTAMVGSLNLGAGVGDVEVRPAGLAEIGGGLEHGIGTFTVDLRDFEWTGDRAEVPVDLAVGELRVTVPDGVDLVVDAEVAAGQVDALDRQASGTGVEETFTFDDPASTRTLRLRLDVGVGHIVVERAGEPATSGAGAGEGGR